jgi:tetratricopeptide (TPR) repeat protein
MRSATLLFLISTTLNGQSWPVCQAGVLEVKNGDYQSAQVALWSCLDAGSAEETDTFYLTLTYRELKNYDAGLSRVDAALRRRPDSVNLLYLAAFLQYRKGENKDSMLLLSKAYKLAPNDWRIHQLFALNYIAFKMYPAVEEELKKAISLNPTNAELEYQLGRLYFNLNWFDKSIEAMKRALALVPDYPEVYDSLGLTYEAIQDQKSAGESFAKAVELDRKHSVKDEWPLINYAEFLFFYDQTPEACVPLLTRALEINPHSPQANYQMGRVMRALHRNAEAEKYFEKTIAADPSFKYAFYQLATLLQKRGDTARAAVYLNRFNVLSRNE